MHGMNAELDKLRSRASDLARQRADRELLALRSELERDTEMWARMWAPACAIAANGVGDRDGAWSLLEDAVAGGFCQPELFEGELEAAFADDERWDKLLRQMRANIPPPAIELLSWPCPSPRYHVELFRLPPEPEERLRRRIPSPETTAWGTAKKLLAWVTNAWEHDGLQHAGDDAHEILDRVEAGERFACVEYSTVLSQALNAVRVPSRQLALRTADHHTGYARGHVVSEAWIDDLKRWVVLDGQNGAFWCDPESDEPLGLVELVRRQRAGGPRPRFIGLTRDHAESAADMWWRYFHTATVIGLHEGTPTGTTWSPAPYSPVFQDRHWLGADLLVTDPAALYPDLTAVHVGLAGSRDEPALRLTAFHPYAVELELHTNDEVEVAPTRPGHLGLPVADVKLPTSPGRQEAEVVVRTPYTTRRAGSVTYLIRPTRS